AAGDIVRMLLVPALPVALALAARRLAPRPENGLHVVETGLVDLRNGDGHGSASVLITGGDLLPTCGQVGRVGGKLRPPEPVAPRREVLGRAGPLPVVDGADLGIGAHGGEFLEQVG